MRIGVDLDNTIVSYDNLIYHIAVDRGLISHDFRKGKKQIRDRIRQIPDGEIEWQKVQAIAYGSRMGEAELIEGVSQFFQACRERSLPTYIVSHKTEYANYDDTGTSLRQAALRWMEQNHFFETDGLGLSVENVYFESTRKEKIARLQALNCTHFIDDLEETFLEPSFPDAVAKILYDPHGNHQDTSQIRVLKRWEDIYEYFFPNS